MKEDELLDVIQEAYEIQVSNEKLYKEKGYNLARLLSVYNGVYYDPNQALFQEHLSEIEALLKEPKLNNSQLQDLGYKLEELALIVFHGLLPLKSIKSYQSPGSQIDLLISGKNNKWREFFKQIPLDLGDRQTSIVVEAKATKKKVKEAQFCRLCNILDINYAETAGLGIFFTIHGASGFPTRNKPRVKALKDCLWKQLIHHSRTGKAVIVFDIDDIRQLGKKGSLIRLINSKISEIEELTGLPNLDEEVHFDDVPERMKKLLSKLESASLG